MIGTNLVTGTEIRNFQMGIEWEIGYFPVANRSADAKILKRNWNCECITKRWTRCARIKKKKRKKDLPTTKKHDQGSQNKFT